MLKHRVEGWSRESYEDAIFAALRRAAQLIASTHDVHVAIKELTHTEEQGFHAVLELTQEPMSVRYELDMEEDPAHQASLEFHRQFRVLRQKEHGHMERTVAAHFEKTGKAPPARPVPDFILAPMTDVSIDNKEVEKEFDQAAHVMKPVPAPVPRPYRSRDLEPEPD